ncbi:MAG: polysaccharide biosynthesis protein [Myxococcota bacterium]|nr:polysaccharide biosynthesis protein [Myxococcota bacterium]
MSRYLTRSLQAAIDLLVLSVAFWLGFLFRFELSIPKYWATVGLANWPYVVGFEYGLLVLLGVTRFSWRYVSLREVGRVGAAIGLATVCLIALRFGLRDVDEGSMTFGFIPLGVLGSNFFLAFVGLVATRASRRLYGESRERRQRSVGRAKDRVLLIGAGQAGVMVAREIASRPDLAMHPVGYLDDDNRKLGMQIMGLPVLGTISQLAKIAELKHVKKVLITIANASGSEIRRITHACRDVGLETKIIPGIYEIVGDRVNLSRIREVAIEDLLGREPVELDELEVVGTIKNSIVMVTGAGGSIGSELCRQVARFAPAKLVLVERFENALFEIHRELLGAFPDLIIEPRVADVTDSVRMESLFKDQTPSIVFHAAAHKHVPMMEENPGEAIKNNVGGTRLIAELSHRYGVDRFVMISTDKAVNPTSVMGATKRVAEIFVQELSRRSTTRFVTVRFGNVLGSNGSVIPIFRQQIERGGPVTVTDPEMKRYFMTIPEASQLVLQAGAMGNGGEIFILDMGEPVKIVDLAREMITLSGFRPDEDIAIEFTGVRPGEKLFEELSTSSEFADKTAHPKIFIGRVRPSDHATSTFDELLALAATGDGERIRAALRVLVPEYAAPAAELPTEELVVVPNPSASTDRGKRTHPTTPTGMATVSATP